MRSEAQIPVTDAANLAKSALTALQTAKSNLNEALFIYNQGTQLARQLQAIQLQLQNMKRLPPTQAIQQLGGLIGSSTAVLAQAQGISFELNKASLDYLQRYGLTAAGSGAAATLYSASLGWTEQLKAASATAIKASAKLADLQSTQGQLGSASSYSETAQGAMEATQAGNRILALQVQQQAALLQLEASATRIEASYYAQMAASEETARLRMTDWLLRDTNAIPVFKPAGQATGGLPMPKFQ